MQGFGGKPEGNDPLEDLGVNVWMRTGALLGYYTASGGNFYNYTTQTKEMHSFLNYYLISVVSYMFQTS
jgi:hypothetical protein